MNGGKYWWMCHGRFNALLRVTISLAHVTLNAGYFSPVTGYCNTLDGLFHIATAMATTPFQADRQNAVNSQKKLHATQAVENREEEGCVYSIPLSDLIGKLLELKYTRSTRAHRHHRLSLNEDLFFQNFCTSKIYRLS